MKTFNKFNCFIQDLGRQVHNLDADTLKVMLTNTAPSVANTVAEDIVEIAAGNGYVADGAVVPNTSFGQVGGVGTLFGDDIVFTASGGSIGPFRYAVLVNDCGDSGGLNPLIGWWDLGEDSGASETVTSGNSYRLATDPVNGIFNLR